jgi:hypothetical protein
MHLTLQESLLTKIVSKQKDEGKCLNAIEQVRQVHTLTIHKINRWQKKMSAIVGHPVFFFWMDRPYLLSLNEVKEKDESGPFYYHMQIH